ncbi:MAG: hypothetical protein ACPGRC_04250 [Salibacteraceae bacterium]
MKSIVLKIKQVFFLLLLTLAVFSMSSCSSECPDRNSDLTVENQWNKPIYVEIYSGGYVTHNASLNTGEQITFKVDKQEVEVRTREKGFILFPDRTTASFDARGCWDYEVIAYGDPNNGERHFLETNQMAK